jgi:glycolate oxidase iron-sulfur subunit
LPGAAALVKNYGDLFADEPELAEAALRVAARTHDIAEVLEQLEFEGPARTLSLTFACHDARSLQHAQKVMERPRG